MMSEEKRIRQILEKHKRSLQPYKSIFGQIGISLELIFSPISRGDYKTAAGRARIIFEDILTDILKSYGIDEKIETFRQISSLLDKHKETIGIDRHLFESLTIIRDFIDRAHQGDELNFQHINQSLSQLPKLLEWYQEVMSEKDVILLGPGDTDESHGNKDRGNEPDEPEPDTNPGKSKDDGDPLQPITDVIDGDTIGNKYKIEKERDKGGMAKIFKAFDRLAKEYRAIKTVPNALAYDHEALERLRNEINNAQKISHPNVIRVYDLFEDRGRYLLVMEYIDGKNLYQVLKDSGDKGLKEYEVIKYMIQVSKGLKEIHRRGIVHLDLKPKNLMLAREGEIKILDFSISKMTDELIKPRTHAYAEGTLPYMAPEQLSENYGKKNEQTDIWSMGATMYFLLSGRYPFGNDPERIKDPLEKASERNLFHVSLKTKNFIMKCLEKDRTKRYKNMTVVLRELNSIKKHLEEDDRESSTSTTGSYLETTDYEPGVVPVLEEEESRSAGIRERGIEFPVVLRGESCERLSKGEVMKMIKEKGFFDSNWNRGGEFRNQFELKSFSSGEVVIDAVVGLMWHPGGTPGFMSLERAGKWLEELNKSSYAGFSDWRLPTLEEAASLLQQRKDKTSFYIGDYFSVDQQCIYTGDRMDETRVWLVDFKEGNIFSDFPNYGYLRPVRSLRLT
ncbi:MAG: protein kinase [Candidatus Aminicenantes bacterium]|nr:MAG: protein kinase [Candidatus Aminicenantes bacterium]